MKQFKGRVVTPGEVTAEAVVTTEGFNTLASFQMALQFGDKEVKCGDQNNHDLYGKSLLGKALCLPQTIGSTTGGMIIQVICSMGINPSCLLFSEHIDSLAGAGVILSVVWENSNLIAIDQLGKEFLETVKTGDTIEVTEDGVVRIL